MKFIRNLTRFAGQSAAVLFLCIAPQTLCDAAEGDQQIPPPDLPNKENTEQVSPKSQDPHQFDWTIRVNDTSTVTIGSIRSTTTLDVTARNASKGILGHYSGSGSGKTVDVNPAYAAKSQAGVDNTLRWDFKIIPILTPLDKPADDVKLAPLGEEGNPDYEGSGTMTIAPRTAVIEGHGIEASKKLQGATFPITLYIIGEKVRLELKTPQGSGYFNGTLKNAKP